MTNGAGIEDCALGVRRAPGGMRATAQPSVLMLLDMDHFSESLCPEVKQFNGSALLRPARYCKGLLKNADESNGKLHS